ncbi:MAG: methanol/ethanol family PQQ-dependent dehydrogenase [Vulcanimicrobiaceae bacterium]
MAMKRGLAASAAAVSIAALGTLAYGLHSAKATTAAAPPTWQAVTDERLANAGKDDGWLMYLRNYRGDGHAPFNQVNTSNVANLKEVFTHDIEIPNGFEAPPIVNGKTMIVTTPLDHIYALDATNGNKLWEYDYKVNPKQLRTVCCDVVNRGVAVYGENAYMETLDNHVLAINATTGKVVWNKTIYPEAGVGFFMSGAPLVVKGKVIVGDGGGEYGARGFLLALDAATGAEKWRKYTIPSPTEKGGDTWPKGDMYKHGGGNPWVTGSYDTETDTLLWGTGNPGPWLSSERPGKNLYTDSILGLNPETGAIKWYFQETPNDPWDYDAVNTPTLADVTIDGKPRKVAYQAGRNGNFYVIDRTNGKLIYTKPFTKVTSVTGYDKAKDTAIINQANVPTTGHEVLTCPAFFGGDNWWSYTFDPQTGYAYVPTMRTCMKISGTKPAKFVGGLGYLDEKFEVQKVPGAYGWGALQAIDVATGKQMWTKETKMPWNDGTLSTDGGLVFSGTPDQKFYAFDAKSGKILWTHQMKSGVIGQPMTYQVDGKQYVAVQSGWGGVSPLWGGPKMVPDFKKIPLGGRLYVFSLDSAAAATKQ